MQYITFHYLESGCYASFRGYVGKGILRLHPDMHLGIFPYAGRIGRDKCKPLLRFISAC